MIETQNSLKNRRIISLLQYIRFNRGAVKYDNFPEIFERGLIDELLRKSVLLRRDGFIVVNRNRGMENE